MEKIRSITRELGLVLFSINCTKETSISAAHALSHCLSVDIDTIDVEKNKVWTEIGFNNVEEAYEFENLAKESLRNYRKNFQAKGLELNLSIKYIGFPKAS